MEVFNNHHLKIWIPVIGHLLGTLSAWYWEGWFPPVPSCTKLQSNLRNRHNPAILRSLNPSLIPNLWQRCIILASSASSPHPYCIITETLVIMNSDKWHPTTSCTSWPQSQAVFDTGAPDWPRLKQGKRRIPYLPETNQNLRLGRIVSLQEVSFPAQLIGNVVIAMVVSLSWVCFWITQNFMSFSTKLSHLGCKSSCHFESFNWIVVKYSILPTSKSLQIGRVFKFSRHVLSIWVQIKMLQASFVDPLQRKKRLQSIEIT